MEEKSKNNNSSRMVGPILGMIAIIGGVYALVNYRFASLIDQNRDLRGELRRHAEENNHPWGVMAEIAKVGVQFTEVETQFAEAEKYNNLRMQYIEDQIAALTEWQQAFDMKAIEQHTRHQERIRTLEREILELRRFNDDYFIRSSGTRGD